MSVGLPDGKRAFDVALAAVLLWLTWPLMLAIAFLIRLTSRGSALFRQERVGRGGETFRIHKFRTMTSSHHGSLVSATGDSRVTRVGRVLRRSKLDELPQLLDVLEGRMSFVGPRPEVPRYVAMWPSDRRAVILSVRPGITDPASIALRNESDELAGVEDPERHYVDVLLPRKTAMYVDYVNRRSFLGDLALISQTVGSVARH